MSSKGYQVFTKLILAGTNQTFDVQGHAFFLIRTTNTVEIKTNKTGFSEFKEKQGITADEGFIFNQIEVRNNNAFDVTVVLWAGFGDFKDVSAFLFDARTNLIGTNETSLASGSELDYDGNPFDENIQRKEIIITNNSVTAGEVLTIRDSADNVVGTVQPGFTLSLQTSDHVNIINNTAGAIAMNVSEVWYLIN